MLIQDGLLVSFTRPHCTLSYFILFACKYKFIVAIVPVASEFSLRRERGLIQINRDGSVTHIILRVYK